MRINRRSLLMGGAALLATRAIPLGAQIRIEPISQPPAVIPVEARTEIVAGLTAPIQIVDDGWGVPHITAESKPDAFFGQGYTVARDRLFQLDYGYRRLLGRLAEAFGPDYIRSDLRAALARYRGDVDAELNAVPPEVKACAEAYVAGINARIAQTAADPSLLPPEYAALGLKPLRWSLAELVAARELVAGNCADEVRRCRLAAIRQLDLEMLVAPPRPARKFALPPGLDPAKVTDADLGLLGSAGAWEADEGGSNAWTIAASRSATGRPILANDPHLSIGGFAPRHVAHLTAPGLNVIGGGAPGLPGIMQGHTDRFAFGRTNSHIDQSDLYILDLHPFDPERYWHRGKWKRFDRRNVTIRVKDGANRTETLRYSVQGPVIAHDPSRSRATALAGVAQMAGGSGIFAMIAINLARDWDSLQAAFRLHPLPTNFHYADIAGNTAWRIIGFAPRRKGGHDGLFPAPGDGRYDWEGLLPLDQLPSVTNPKEGWFASANQNNLPRDYKQILAYTFREPWRYERVAQVLREQPQHSLADSAALQQDVLSGPARRFIELLPQNPAPAARPAIDMLRAWDGRISGDSAAAALYELVRADLETRLINVVVPIAARALVPQLDMGAMLGLLAEPDKRFGPNPTGSRDLILSMSLIAGWESATQLLGPEPALWRWGTLHQLRIAPPRSPAPPIEVGGSGGDEFTVNARWLGEDWRVAGGASYLQVIDVGNWDDSLYLNLPGQSGDPRSRHYRDMAQPWIEGRMQPLIFSPDRIDADASARTTLQPPAAPIAGAPA